jgi:hypothetical protein
VGFEIACALQRATPVLCCMRRGVRVSKMLTGNDSPGLRLVVYEGQDEALKAVDAFLQAVGLGRAS